MPKQSRSVLRAALFMTVAAFAAPAVAETGAPAAIDMAETRTIELTKDSAIALQSEAPFRELSVANPNIADISTISNTGIYVVGKTPGRTTLMLMGDAGEVMTVYDVRVAPDISELKVLLREILPGAQIEAFTANDGIVLAGTASSEAEKQRAEALASRYAPGRVSNLLSVSHVEPKEADLSTFGADLARLLPDEAIRADVVAGGIVLYGVASSDAAQRRAMALAEQAATGDVVSFIEVAQTDEPAPDAGEVARSLALILPDETIEVHLLGGALVLSGQASSDEAARRAVEVARLSAAGAPISNMIEVAAEADCEIRTRRGAEVIVTTIPCNDAKSAPAGATTAAAKPEAEAEAEAGEAVAMVATLRPRPRPEGRLAAN